MHGGRKSKRDTFSLLISKGKIITEEKVSLLIEISIALLLRSRNSGVRAKVANALVDKLTSAESVFIRHYRSSRESSENCPQSARF